MNDYGEINEFYLNLNLRIFGLRMNIVVFLEFENKDHQFFLLFN